MPKKIVTYVLMISRVFPKTHPKSGQPTYFKARILANECLTPSDLSDIPPIGFLDLAHNPKRHTIRTNYELWAKRADKINRGEAVLSLRQWTGSPYKSKQREFMQLTKIGVQRVYFEHDVAVVYSQRPWREKPLCMPWLYNGRDLAKNDGLSFDDFWTWFCPPFKNPSIGRIMKFEGCIIHFSDFKYNG